MRHFFFIEVTIISEHKIKITFYANKFNKEIYFNEIQLTLTQTRRRRSASSLASSPSSFSNDSVIVTYVGRPSGNSHCIK